MSIMKRIIISLCLVGLLPAASMAALPRFHVKEAVSLDRFAPKGWSVGESATGDLNKDGREDIAALFFLPGKEEENYVLALLLAADLGFARKGYVLSAAIDINTVFGIFMGCSVFVDNGDVVLNLKNGRNDSNYKFRREDAGWRLIEYGQYSYFSDDEYYSLTHDLITGKREEEDAMNEPGKVKKSAGTVNRPPIYLEQLKNADDLAVKMGM